MLNRIGNSVGKLVNMDKNTQVTLRVKYARMAVLVNLNKPLILKVDIRGKVQLIEYENMPNIFFRSAKPGTHLSRARRIRTRLGERQIRQATTKRLMPNQPLPMVNGLWWRNEEEGTL